MEVAPEMRQLGSTFVRYIIVAVLAYLLDIGVFSLLYQSGLASIAVSNVAGKVSTAIFGFFAHRRITFQIKDSNGLAREALKFFTVAALHAPFTTALLLLLAPLSPTTTIAKLLADTIGVVATFAISKLFIFHRRSETSDLSQP